MNHTLIAGNLGSDPEVRFTSSGQKIVTFRVASNQRKGGKDETTWWRVTYWGDGLDKMMPYLKKGTGLIITGELQKPEIFTDKEGKPQISLNLTATSVSFSPFGKGRSEEGAAPRAPQQNAAAQSYGGYGQQPAAPAVSAEDNFSYGGSYDYAATPSHSSMGGYSDEEIPF